MGLLSLFSIEAYEVELTFLESAVAKGAVCLDGSAPAYHMDKGFGAGTDNWLVFFEGGGWCHNVTNCLARRDTRLGSSKKMLTTETFSGMFHNKPKYNPDFYDWNRIKVRYCDGASFTGDVEAVDPKTNLYFRGARIFRAVIEDLLAKGMKNAKNAMLAGCSAGGLTSILQCDNFRSLLPATTKVKCLSDAGFFINAKTIIGTNHIEGFYADVVRTHGSAKVLSPACTAKMSPGYGQEFLKALTGFGNSPSRGMFINSCYSHCQTGTQETWLRNDSPLLSNMTIAKAVGDWYYERGTFQKIDCPYPRDKTCHNRVFE